MDLSIFYAKLIGFYFVIVAISMLVNPKNIQTIIAELSQNKIFIISSGLLSLLGGLAIVLTHNVWYRWSVIITVLGYLLVIRGIVRLCFTDWFAQFALRAAQLKLYYVLTIVILVLGAGLLYFGYMSA